MTNLEQDHKDFFRISFSEHRYEFKLEVRNFYLLPHEAITVPPFYPDRKREFSANFGKGEDSEYYYLKFNLVSGDDIYIEHFVTVKDKDKNTLDILEKNHWYAKNSKTCQFAFEQDDFFKYYSSWKDLNFVFQCVMKMTVSSCPDLIAEKIPLKVTMERNNSVAVAPPTSNGNLHDSLKDVYSKPVDNLSILSHDLGNLISDPRTYDLTIYVGDESISAHSAILCARSLVFDRMIADEDYELTITNLETSVFKALLKFLYTGKLSSDNFETVSLLYHAACLYEVSSLETTCIRKLLSKLEVGNACRALLLADQRGNKHFKDLVVFYIQSRYSDISQTEDFAKLEKEHPFLTIELMKKVLSSFASRYPLNN